jgi:hypothetical protein
MGSTKAFFHQHQQEGGVLLTFNNDKRSDQAVKKVQSHIIPLGDPDLCCPPLQ